MLETVPSRGSLVLYKGLPARVQRTGKKLDIELEEGRTLSVRQKDVQLLHPGPIQSLSELERQANGQENSESDISAAAELLEGDQADLTDLADLIYGTYTPATAWAAWQLVADGLYFFGSPGMITPRTPKEVAQEKASRAARASEAEAWTGFMARIKSGQVLPEDDQFLRGVGDLALGRTAKSRVLRELGRSENQEAAHELLLKLGLWDDQNDPYPKRLGLSTSAVAISLPQLPDEARTDLTHLPAFAIDDEGNQEPDDAIGLDGSRLWVHVADVSALVPPNSAADIKARGRGASLYLPEGTVQMLPSDAIERLGLGLAEVSPALSFGIDLGEGGEIEHTEVVSSWVRVTRLTYAEAEAQLDEEPLRSLHKVTKRCGQRRKERGSVHIDLPEVRIRVVDGSVTVAPLLKSRSRQVVTEAMLMAGEAAARLALREEIPLPFTSQQPPRMEERPTDTAGMFALRRSSFPSDYSLIPGPHAGLGLPVYAQATSPLRRYLDLVVHQQFRAYLRGEDLLDAQEIVERVGATTAVSRGVKTAERLARRHWTLVYLMQQPDWQGEGVLVDRYRAKTTVLIPELELDVQVHVRDNLPLNHILRLGGSQVNLPSLSVHFRILE